MQWKPIEIVLRGDRRIIINELLIESVSPGSKLDGSENLECTIQMASGAIYYCVSPHYVLWLNDTLIAE